MELKGKYSFDYNYLEASVREAYTAGIEELRGSQGLEACLNVINDIFSSLGKSHPAPGRGTEWGEDIIKAYRSLGEILKELVEDIPKGKVVLPEDREPQKRIEAFENAFS